MLDTTVEIISVDEMIEGMYDNMEESELDSDLRLFRRISREVAHTNNYNTLYVVVDAPYSDYDPESIDPYMEKKSLTEDVVVLRDDAGLTFAREIRYGTMFLYFKDQATAEKYVSDAEEYAANIEY